MALEFQPAPTAPTPPFSISGTPYYIAMFNAAGDNVVNSNMFTTSAKEIVVMRSPNGSVCHFFTGKNNLDENNYSIFWADGANASFQFFSDEYVLQIAEVISNTSASIGVNNPTLDPFVRLSQNGGTDPVFDANLSGVRTVDPTGHTKKYWKLGEAEAGAPTADTTLYVEVDGVVYKIAAEAVPPPSLLLLEDDDFLLLENNDFIELE